MFTEGLSQSKLTGVTRKVLVVEADPQLRKSMSVQFERMNFHVLSANHYDGALHHLAKGDLHVVCVDVQLPSKSGYELCEHIRGSLGLVELPILMTSEYGSPEENGVRGARWRKRVPSQAVFNAATGELHRVTSPFD